MITTRRLPRKDWSWLYIVSFILLGIVTYGFEQEIEMNQLVLAVDYN